MGPTADAPTSLLSYHARAWWGLRTVQPAHPLRALAPLYLAYRHLIADVLQQPVRGISKSLPNQLGIHLFLAKQKKIVLQ
jgi:hypothetical protein